MRERDSIVITRTGEAVHRQAPRVVLAGHGSGGLVLGPLTVARIMGAVHRQEEAERATTIARALASDLHAQLRDLPTAATVGDLFTGLDMLRAQLERVRALVEGAR